MSGGTIRRAMWMRARRRQWIAVLALITALPSPLLAAEEPAIPTPASVWRNDVSARTPREPEAQATGIFLNRAGDVLTARHAVEGCRRLFVVKDGRAARAWLQVAAKDMDAAVLITELKPLLVATFPSGEFDTAAPTPVFAEGYSALRAMPNRDQVLFNALTVPGEARFSMLSPVRPGASGSAVLNAHGLVLAMVVDRTARAPGQFSARVLSRNAGHTPTPASGASEVNAVPAVAITKFLRDNFVAFEQSDATQLGRDQARAPRAATLSVGVICDR